MKFSISAELAQRAVKALGVVVRVNAVDSSGRVLIKVSDEAVNFSANNGATSISFKSDSVLIEREGEVAIGYGKLKSFVSSFKSWNGERGVKEFRFSASKKRTIIRIDNKHIGGSYSKGELRLSNFNAALIPKLPKFGETTFTVNSSIFREATTKVLYAVNPTASLNVPALQGVNVRFDGASLFFAGSNGVVLSEYEAENESDKNEGDIILQYDFVMGLRRLIPDDTELLWEVKDNLINVKFDEVVYSGRRIIGHQYPDYQPAFENFKYHVDFEKDFLVNALSPFLDVLDSEDNFRITLEIKDKMFKLHNEIADMESEQDITGGLDFSMDLNGRYLIQTIDNIKDDDVIFRFSDEDGYAIFDASKFNNQKALITPIKKR